MKKHEVCGVCHGSVKITDPDALDRHMRIAHDATSRARVAPRSDSPEAIDAKNDVIAGLGSALRIPGGTR